MWFILSVVITFAECSNAALDPLCMLEATGNCSGYYCETFSCFTGHVTECNDGDTTININKSSSGDLVVTSFIPRLVNLSQISTRDLIDRLKLDVFEQLNLVTEACSSILPLWITSIAVHNYRDSLLSVDLIYCGSEYSKKAIMNPGPKDVMISFELENFSNRKLGRCSASPGEKDCRRCYYASLYDPVFNRLNISFKLYETQMLPSFNIGNLKTTTDVINNFIHETTGNNKSLLIVLCSVLIPVIAILICILVTILVIAKCRREKHTNSTGRLPTISPQNLHELDQESSYEIGYLPSVWQRGHHDYANLYSRVSITPNVDDTTCHISDAGKDANDYNNNDSEENYIQLPTPSQSREDSPRVAMKLMKLVFQPSNGKEGATTRQVFIHYHDDELDWIEYHLIPFLRDSLKMVVSSKEDFCPGSIPVEEQIQSISLSEYVILVLSDSFVRDSECRDVTTRAYSSSPQKVVPLGLRLTINLESDPLFWSLVQTNGLIEWSEEAEEQGIFWQRLRERLSAPDEEQVCIEERIQIVKECLTEWANKYKVNKTQTSGDTEGTRSHRCDRTIEVFVYYHDNESSWTNDSLIPYLEKTLMMVVQTKEDILPGSVTLEEILKNIQLSDMLIFVISDSFIDDQECRETITRSIAIKPNGIVQVILDLEGGKVKHGSGMHTLILGMAHVDNRIHIRDPTGSNFTELGVCLNRIVAQMVK